MYLVPFVRKNAQTIFLKTIFPSRTFTKKYLSGGGVWWKKTRDVFDVKLDQDENELLESVEAGEWSSVANIEEELAFAKEAAANFLRKDERITLRLSSGDLDRLKQKAAYKGLPYQTFIASVLHKYAAGHFKDVA